MNFLKKIFPFVVLIVFSSCLKEKEKCNCEVSDSIQHSYDSTLQVHKSDLDSFLLGFDEMPLENSDHYAIRLISSTAFTDIPNKVYRIEQKGSDYVLYTKTFIYSTNFDNGKNSVG